MKLLIDRIQLVLRESSQLGGVEGQAGLAKAAGASKSVVNQWLHGSIKTMGIDYALNLEEALGYNHVWLMTGRGEILIESQAKPAMAPLDKDIQIVVDMLKSTDSEGRILAKNAVIDALTDYRKRRHEVDILTGKVSAEVTVPGIPKERSASGL